MPAAVKGEDICPKSPAVNANDVSLPHDIVVASVDMKYAWSEESLMANA